MNDLDSEADDAEVIQMALNALDAAHRRARVSGLPVVMVKNGNLVRVEGANVTVLKTLPPRQKVSIRVKRVQS